MAESNKPVDGDFAPAPRQETAPEAPKRQTLSDVLVSGEEPTDEFLGAFNELNNAPQVPDDELERQALAHPGDDGDPATPE